jgi:hypothetical protein
VAPVVRPSYEIPESYTPQKIKETIPQAPLRTEKKVFNFTIDSQRFIIVVAKDSRRSLHYFFEGEILKIEISTERELDNLHLKLICKCVELYDISKKITKGDIGALENLI